MNDLYSKYNPPPIFKYIISSIALISSVLLLLSLAYHNGYVLTMSDSSGYVLRAFTRGVNHHWALFYSLFVRILSFGDSLWWIIVIQNILISYLIFRLFKHIINNYYIRILGFSITIIVLNYFSTLPFISNLVMSDIFICYGILALVLIYLSPKLSIESLLLAFLFAVSIIAHNSHIVILGSLFLAFTLLFSIFLYTKKYTISNFIKKELLIISSFLLASLFLKPLVNSYFIFEPDGKTVKSKKEEKVSDSKYHFVWAKLSSNKKIYNQFLEKYCPIKKYSYLCNQEKMLELSADEDGLRDDFHGTDYQFFYEIEDAGKTMLFDIDFFPHLFTNAFNRLWYIFTNFQLKNAYYDKYFEEIIQEHVPNDLMLVQSSLSFGSQFLTSTEIKHKRKINSFVCYLSLILIIVSILFFIIKKTLNRSSIFIILFGFIAGHFFNCFLFGIAGNIFNARYSSRVSWLLVLSALFIIFYIIDNHIVKKSLSKS